ncbi:response regulator [Mongoliitalea daihaiensis]|uniref:response regulator n=1 Tax=Mongoliitalea daihaiensis TaxID=2782006 RepID=UPI001F19F017|nr:response regulator [Mongoliitalea daihaiensis]UJP63931.1 response regulator [Mongoliitalea daihaiensis]
MEEQLKKCKILIIDDKESNVDLLTELLETHGYQSLATETDARNAIAQIDQFKPDLVLLDLMMPHISGFDILKIIQGNPTHYAHLKVLVLTADVTLPTKQKALSLGAHDFLTKPFDLVEVTLRIKNLLLNAYLFKQLQKQNQMLEEKVAERTKELSKSNEAIKEQLNALKDIAWMQSHIVRAPLARILGLIDILHDHDLTQKAFKKTMLQLEHSAKELDQVVKEITEKTYTRDMFE